MQTKKPKILIIDDEKSLCTSLVKLLAQNEFVAKYEVDPKKGLCELRKRSQDIILLDIRMPKIDGVTCLAEIKKILPNAKVIILTGYPSVDTAVETMKLDAFDYVKKPFDPQQLISTIKRAAVELGFVMGEPLDVNLTVGKNIKDCRLQKQLTIKDISDRTELSRGLISQIENGKSAPSLSTLYKISSSLGVALNELVKNV